MRLPALALCALASPAFSQGGVLPGSSLAAATPRPKPIVLTNREMIGAGIPRSFTIPDQPSGTDTLRVQLFTRQWTRLGGQNRSGQVHPGFDYSPEAAARAGLNQFFVDENGMAAFPSSWNAHIVLFEWGPTLPASPSEWIDPQDWPWACESNPTCYWGAATFNGDKDHRDQWREYTIQQGSPWYPAAQTPGAVVSYIPVLWWDGGEWDGSHAWPVAIEWEQTTLLWLSWE